jgi:tRNA(adenine34) deaminase
MREAIRQAFLAFDAKEVPVGAVMVRQGRIIGRAFNQTELLKDPTAHAEMIAITQAANAIGDWRLTGCTLFVTKEPCPMCAGALVLARVDRVVFGAYDVKRGGAVSAFQILSDQRLNHRPEVVGGVEEEAARTLLVEFFKMRRAGDALDMGPLPFEGGHN